MVTESRPSNQKRVIILGIAALVVVLLAGVVIALLVLRGDGESGAAAAESAKLMPENAFAFVAFNPHLDQAKNFDVLDEAWGDNPDVQKGLSDMLDSMKEEGIDYKADIEPWLGNEISFSIGAGFMEAMGSNIEQTFAEIEGSLSGEMTEPAAMAENPEMTLAIATTDTAASDKFLAKLRTMAEEDGQTLQETDYKGTKIVYSEPAAESDTAMAYATVADFVVITVGGLEPMQAVIDAKDGANLAGNENYKAALDKLPADQILYGYMDAAGYMEMSTAAMESQLAGLPSGLFNLEAIKATKAMGYSVGLAANGVNVDAVTIYDSAALPENLPLTTAIANKSAGRVPAGALLYLAGSGLDKLVEMGIEAAKSMSENPEEVDEQIKMGTAMLGVSVEELIEMLSGEFALAVTHDPAGIGGDPSMPVGVSFLLEAKDEEQFQKLINSVTGLLGFSGESNLSQETINGVEVTTVPNPSGGMVAGWGVGGGYFAAGTSEDLLGAAFGAEGAKLADDADYKAAVEPLPDSNSALFFMDVKGFMEIVGASMDPWEQESFDEGRAWLEPITAIAAGSEPVSKDKDFAVGRLFVLIQSGE